MSKEEVGSPIESEMRRRAKAKRTIACVEEKLEAIQHSLGLLGRAYLLNPNSLDLRNADKGCLRFLPINEPPGGGWVSIAWPDLGEISRLVRTLQEARRDLGQAEQRLADLGVPI